MDGTVAIEVVLWRMENLGKTCTARSLPEFDVVAANPPMPRRESSRFRGGEDEHLAYKLLVYVI